MESFNPAFPVAEVYTYEIRKRFTFVPTAFLDTLEFRYPLTRMDFPNQTVTNIVTSPQANTLVDDPAGNKMAIFYLSNKKSGETVVVDINYTLTLQKLDLKIDADKIPSVYSDLDGQTKSFLNPQSANPLIRDLAKKITRGLTHPLDKAKAIYDYVVQYFSYENIENVSGRKSAGDTFFTGKGNCADITELFVNLARLNDIPARRIGGVVFQPRASENVSVSTAGHAWAEIYLPVYGWLPVDATFGLVEKDKFFLFPYAIHLRECYGQIVSTEPGSLFRGAGVKVRTLQKFEQIPLDKRAEITIEQLAVTNGEKE